MFFDILGVEFPLFAPQAVKPATEARRTVDIFCGKDGAVCDVYELPRVILRKECRQFFIGKFVDVGYLGEVRCDVVMFFSLFK